MSTTNPGQIRFEQLQKVTWAGDASHLASSVPAYASLVDPALAAKGSEFWHPASIPMDTSTGGFTLDGTSRKFKVYVDAISVTINGSGKLEAPALISGGTLPVNNIPLYANGGLRVVSGGLSLQVAAPLALAGNVLDVDKATSSTDGTVIVDTAYGLLIGTPTAGNLRINADSATLAFSAGALKVKDNTFLNLTAVTTQTVTGPVAFGQTISLSSHKITNVQDPTSAQDAATKAYVDGAVASGAPVPQPAVKGFAATGTNLNIGGITNGDYVIATSASMYSSNAIGDLLHIVDKTGVGAARFDAKIAASGLMLVYSDDTVDSGTHSAGQYLYNSGATAGPDGTKWFLSVAAAAVAVATEITAVAPAAGKVIAGHGLFIANGTTGDMRVRLGTDLGSPVSTALSLVDPGDGTNHYLQLKYDSAFFSITNNGISLLDGGITSAKIASGTIMSDRLAFQANPGLLSGVGVGLKVKVKASAGLTLDSNGLSVTAAGITEAMVNHDITLHDAGGGALGLFYDATKFTVDPDNGLQYGDAAIVSTNILLGDGLHDGGAGALAVNAAAPFTFTGGALDLAASGVKAAKIDKGNGLGTSGTSVIVVANTATGIQVDGSGVGIAASGIKYDRLNLAAASALKDGGAGAIAVAVDDKSLEISSNKLQVKTSKFNVVTRFAGTTIPAPSSGDHLFTISSPGTAFVTGSVRVYINGIEVESTALTVNDGAHTVTVHAYGSVHATVVPYVLDRSATGDTVTIVSSHV